MGLLLTSGFGRTLLLEGRRPVTGSGDCRRVSVTSAGGDHLRTGALPQAAAWLAGGAPALREKRGAGGRTWNSDGH